jgi:putative holliday junction resolvase
VNRASRRSLVSVMDANSHQYRYQHCRAQRAGYETGSSPRCPYTLHRLAFYWMHPGKSSQFGHFSGKSCVVCNRVVDNPRALLMSGLMTVIGFDLGRRRIGVAVAASSIGARPLVTIERRSATYVFAALRSLIDEWEAERVVVGLPLNMDGSEGAAARYARRFAIEMAAQLHLPVELHDERLTSFEARERLKQSNLNRGARHTAEDAVAAALILEGWLEARNNAVLSSSGEPGGLTLDPVDTPAIRRNP